jgi:hypothetical protein
VDAQQNGEERAVAVLEPPTRVAALASRDGAAVGIIRPVASADEVLSAWRQFQDIKRSLLTIEDYQEIQGRPRIKKSGWRKIAAAFGISDQIVREERREIDSGTPSGRYFVWEITVRAVAPNGRFSDAVGSCASNERRFAHLDHDVRAIANTRAKNRAIADLVGGGEVSAEELEAELEHRGLAGPVVGGAANGVARGAAVSEPAARWSDDGVTDAQLRAIRAHLARTGIDEARACTRAGVESLDALTRRGAAELLAALSRQPNAA